MRLPPYIHMNVVGVRPADIDLHVTYKRRGKQMDDNKILQLLEMKGGKKRWVRFWTDIKYKDGVISDVLLFCANRVDRDALRRQLSDARIPSDVNVKAWRCKIESSGWPKDYCEISTWCASG